MRRLIEDGCLRLRGEKTLTPALSQWERGNVGEVKDRPMRLPVICGVIERRILVNYRVDADVLARLLPEPFRPQLVSGYGVAGICLIRLGQVRPKRFPSWMGIASENAAHRVAVEWDESGELKRGVYVMRRDTNSRLNAVAGGRIFPGLHHHARFDVREAGQRYEIDVTSDDGEVEISVAGEVARESMSGSVFESLTEASAFFEAGSIGYSPAREAGRYEGLELRCRSWRVTPLEMQQVRSSVFDNEEMFPKGTAEFDCALLMRGVEHEWHERGCLDCGALGYASQNPGTRRRAAMCCGVEPAVRSEAGASG